MCTIEAFHGSASRFRSFKNSDYGIHAGTYDQAAHAATLKLGEIPLEKFEALQVDSNGWRGIIYRVRLDLGKSLRVEDPGTPKKWKKVISSARKNGYESIVYLNQFEGREEAESYCVFDSSKITILDL